MSGELPSLLGINTSTLKIMIEAFAANSEAESPAVVLSSSIETPSDRTNRLIAICRAEAITHLIMGADSQREHDVDRLALAGIELVEHLYTGPSDEAALPGASALHYVFSTGLEKACQWMTEDWNLQKIDGFGRA